jgi:hypothetical protein
VEGSGPTAERRCIGLCGAAHRLLADVAGEVLLSRGRPEPSTVQKLLAAGYEEKHLLGIVLAIGIKTLSNYTNPLFDTPLDGVFKVREFKAFKATQRIVELFAPLARAAFGRCPCHDLGGRCQRRAAALHSSPP